MSFFKPIFNELQNQLDKGARILLKDEADKVIAETKKLTPVDTGTLRNNFSRTDVNLVDGKYFIEVVNNTEYAVPVEYGHRTRKGLGKKSSQVNSKFWVKGFFMLEQGLQKILVGFAQRLREKIPELKETK